MNSADRLEFEQIQRDQGRVRELVDRLERRIDLLGLRLDSPPPVSAPAAVPPPLPSTAFHQSWYEEPPESVVAAQKAIEAAEPPPPSVIPEPLAKVTAPLPPASTAEPLELRVGTYWMARIGIVILLTGLVFLGNYAYHRIVPMLGAWGKLALLAVAGTTLGALGAWLERSRESTRNFGRVLLAGGAATIYYTVYAAHFVDALRVIDSPVVGGVLLLALTGAFVAFADRRKSEAVAVPAVLLAYYTSAINAISDFTLFSNLLLTAVAVFFLVRHRWTRLSFLSLVATYGSYAFWRLEHPLASNGAFGELGTGVIFLGLYWVLFSAAVFLAGPTTLRGPERIAFLTLNNGAFFAFAALHFSTFRPDAFWIFALSFGSILLGFSALAARLRSEQRALDGTYLAQGLAVVTLGLVAKLTGPQLATVLAVESAVLLIASRQRHRWIYELVAGLCALGSWVLAIDALDGAAAPLARSLPIIALLLFDAWWVKRMQGEMDRFSERAAGFAVLGLLAGAALIWKVCPLAWQPAAFALVAAISLATLRLRLPEIAWPGQAFLAGGLLFFVSRYADAAPQPAWLGAPLILIALALMHWWQRQRAVAMPAMFRALPQVGCAVVAVVTAFVSMRDFYHGSEWLVATSVAAVVVLIYSILTQCSVLGAVGQIFTAAAVISFIDALLFENVSRWSALAPVLSVAMTAGLASFVQPKSVFAELRIFIRAYRYVASAMLAAWAFVFIPEDWRVAFYAGMAALQLVIGAATASRERRTIGAVYSFAALAIFWCRLDSQVVWSELLAILVVPASIRLSQRLCGDTPLLPAGRDALVAAAMASLWLWVTRWMVALGHGGQLTAGWALLALAIFSAGLALRERIYRLGGFGILALAIGRLFIVDVWRFDTLPRIVSFLVLGVVLLTLSFVYHRFAETFRRWL